MEKKTKHIFRFDAFCLDPEEGILECAEGRVDIEKQAFCVLVELVRHSPQLVKREDLRKKLWPDDQAEPSVLDQRLAQSIARIRKAFREAGAAQDCIETVPGMGFRFLAQVSVEEVSVLKQAHSSVGTSTGLPTGNAARRKRWVIGALIVVLVLVAVGWRYWRAEAFRAPKLRQLTTNSAEMPVRAGAISPDGKYLAYADDAGVYLKLIEQNVQHPLPALYEFQSPVLSWFPTSDRLLLSGKRRDDAHSSLWTVSILQGAPPPAKLLDEFGEVGAAAVAPDGSQIAFVCGGGKEVWLMGNNGESPHQVWAGADGDKFAGLAWLDGGGRLVLNHLQLAGSGYTISLELLDLATRRNSTLVQDAGLRGGCAAVNGRVIYSLMESAENPNDASLWEIKIDPATGERTGAPRRVARLDSSTAYHLSIAADGKRLAFFKGAYQADVYLAEIEQGGLKNVRRLTHDDRNDLPTAWTPDGRAVLFHSDRNGKFQIFRQDIAESNAELLTGCPDGCRGARVSADGAWVFYLIHPDWWRAVSKPPRLMRFPFVGGRAEMMMEELALFSVRCARAPATRCVMAKRTLSESGTLIFYEFDPLSGQGKELARTAIDLPAGREHWDISPDGSQIAAALGGSQSQNGVVRVIGIDGTTHDVVIKGWSEFHSLDWNADGSGWYISSLSAQASTLLRVDGQGNAQILRQSVGGFETWGIPSPDGSRLAFLEWSATNDNIWVIEEF